MRLLPETSKGRRLRCLISLEEVRVLAVLFRSREEGLAGHQLGKNASYRPYVHRARVVLGPQQQLWCAIPMQVRAACGCAHTRRAQRKTNTQGGEECE